MYTAIGSFAFGNGAPQCGPSEYFDKAVSLCRPLPCPPRHIQATENMQGSPVTVCKPRRGVHASQLVRKPGYTSGPGLFAAGVPTWAWIAGAVVLGTGAALVLRRRRAAA